MTASSSDPFKTPAPALDDAALARLRELDPTGQAGIVARVLSTFHASLQRLQAQFAAAQAAGDAEAMRQVAHTLRSSSASVGALDLSTACKGVENAVREGRLADLPAEVQRLQAEFPRAAAAVSQALDAGGRA